jgi:hypothetical protein
MPPSVLGRKQAAGVVLPKSFVYRVSDRMGSRDLVFGKSQDLGLDVAEHDQEK